MSTVSFFHSLAMVDQRVAEASSADECLEQIAEILDDRDVCNAFFSRLNDPAFIRPLLLRGFFEDPPKPERLKDGALQSRAWAQMGYLIRMADIAPSEVTEVLKSIQTDNWLIARDMIRAAKAMPPEYVDNIARSIGEHAHRLKLSYMLDDVGAIVKNLAESGFDDAAFALVSDAFDIRAFAETRQSLERAEYTYLGALRESVVPALIPVKPREFLELLCGWLSRAIEIEKEAQAKPPEDYSYIWRPAIEDHGQNRDHGFAPKMVPIVRDAFEAAVRNERISLNDAINILGEHNWHLFDRLKVHLVAEYCDENKEIARSVIMVNESFDSLHLKHEYARLIGKGFGLLTQEERNQWFEWVKAGPSWMKEDETGEEEHRQRIEYWQFNKCHLVRDHLQGEWKDFYDRMLKERGTPRLADLVSYSSGARHVSDESPYTVDEMAAMGFEKILETLETWQSEDEGWRFEGPTRAGLVRTFREYVEREAENLVDKASELKNRHPLYVRAYLEGIEKAVKDGRTIDISPVLELCEWVTQQPVDRESEPINIFGELVEKDWHWTYDHIGSLIKTFCEAKTDDGSLKYSIEFRETFANLIRALLDVPAKRYVREDEDDGDIRTVDWVMVIINSPRGKAMETLFAFARWVATHLHGDPSEHPLFPGKPEELSDLMEILESQLTRENPDFTERGAFGHHLNLIYWMDRDWLEKHADQIFDLAKVENDPEHAYGWAAWNAFVFAMQPHKEFYRILKKQFDYVVDQAKDITLPSRSHEEPFGRMGEHLMILYGRGDLGEEPDKAWEADNGIIRRMVGDAVEQVRTHTVEFIGRSLYGSDQDLLDETRQRFMRLWESYWEAVGRDDASRDPTTMVFGYWFCSGIFEPDWTIVQLEKLAEVAPKAEPDSMIVERLAEICDVDPLRSARIVGFFVKGDDDGWRVPSWKDDAKIILQKALEAGGEAKAEAEQVIDQLGRRGFLEFGKLRGFEI